MSKRLYLSKIETLEPSLGFRPGAVGPAWFNVLGSPTPPVVAQIVDSVDPAQFAIGVLDTNGTQHSTLTAATSRIRYIPQSLFATPYSELSAQAKQAVDDVQTFLGFNLVVHNVELIVWAIAGHSVAKGVSELSDLV